MSLDRFWLPCFNLRWRSFFQCSFSAVWPWYPDLLGSFPSSHGQKIRTNYTYKSCSYPSTVPLTEVPLVENFVPFTRVFRSTKTTLRQSVESIVFNHLAHLYSLVTAVVQELLSKTWKRTLDFIQVYIRYDWLLLGDNQKKGQSILAAECSLSHKIQT